METIKERLEYLRTMLREERISYGELLELESLAEHIEPGDVELLEAAGVPEFEEEKFEIEDWAGNLMFDGKTFDSFEEGWSFIYENILEEYEGDGTYEDVYVVPVKERKAELYLNN